MLTRRVGVPQPARPAQRARQANEGALGLVELTPEQFGEAAMVAFPPEPSEPRWPTTRRLRSLRMIRRPLRPLARILKARAEGKDPNLIEAEERAARLAALHRAERAKAETRLLLLGILFILGFSTVAGRMALLSAAVPVEPRSGIPADPIQAQRADIVDRSGVVLATNIVTASLYAQPQEMIDPHAAADALGRIFPDLDRQELYRRFTDGRKFLWIKRTISPEQRQQVHDLGEPGLLFGPRETRLYPNGAVAAHVLGGASFGREGVHAAEVIGTAGRRAGLRRRGCAIRPAPASRCGSRSTSGCRPRSRTCWRRACRRCRPRAPWAS